MPYFERTGETGWTPTEHVGGAWDVTEQHVGPALGLLAHLVEADRDRRRDDGLVLSRLSYDILGTLPMDEVTVVGRGTPSRPHHRARRGGAVPRRPPGRRAAGVAAGARRHRGRGRARTSPGSPAPTR